jgi:hypothetical protein
VDLDQFDLAKEKGFWRFQLVGFICRDHSAIFGFFRRDFDGGLICIESGTISPRGGRNCEIDLLMRRYQASVFNKVSILSCS